AGAVAVQGARHQFLTGTGLAVDQHGDVGLRQPADGPEDFLHGGGFTDDLRVGIDVGDTGVLALLFLGVGEGALGNGDGVVYVEGFRQIFKRAALIGSHRTVQIGVSGHDDDRYLRMVSVQVAQQRQPVDTGHADVADDGIGYFTIQLVQCAVTGIKNPRINIGLLQGLLQHPADGTIVINDPDTVRLLHVVLPLVGRG